MLYFIEYEILICLHVLILWTPKTDVVIDFRVFLLKKASDSYSTIVKHQNWIEEMMLPGFSIEYRIIISPDR